MKKVIIVLIIAILIVAVVVGFKFYSGSKKQESETPSETPKTEEYYGKRGEISETDRIKFLSKNDEYLVGMIGLPVSNEVRNFSNDDMIRFALNIAVERYSSMLETRTRSGVSQYIIEEETVNMITKEYFGIANVPFDELANPYYSRSNDAFLFNESIEKVLYYYPVSQLVNEAGTKEITADAIFISDNQAPTDIESAKYEGKYTAENVDSTIKFIFNAEGYLTGYQYL